MKMGQMIAFVVTRVQQLVTFLALKYVTISIPTMSSRRIMLMDRAICSDRVMTHKKDTKFSYSAQ